MALGRQIVEPVITIPKATVFIVDDDPDVRRAIALLVHSVDLRTEVYSSAQEFLNHFDPRAPGCLVLDIRMPGMDGLELQKRLDAQVVRIPIIFVTSYGDIPMATEAIRSGALDFIQKPFDPQTMLDRIQEAIQYDRGIRRKQAIMEDAERRQRQLTDREREVMYLLAGGASTKMIASKLGIRSKTVDSHRARIFEKMGIDNSAQLAWLIAQSEQGIS